MRSNAVPLLWWPRDQLQRREGHDRADRQTKHYLHRCADEKDSISGAVGIGCIWCTLYVIAVINALTHDNRNLTATALAQSASISAPGDPPKLSLFDGGYGGD